MGHKSGAGARAKRKLKKKEERKAQKRAKIASKQRAGGGQATSATGEQISKKTNHHHGFMQERLTERAHRAQERQQARDQLTAEEQLEVLDERFGRGNGATRERLRLMAQIAKRDEKKPEPKIKTEVPAVSDEKKSKKQRRKHRDEKK